MRYHLGFYLLFHTLPVSCVEKNLSQIKAYCSHLNEDLSCSSKGICELTAPEYCARNMKDEPDPSPGIKRGSKLDTHAEIKSGFPATAVNTRHRNYNHGSLEASSSREDTPNLQNKISPKPSQLDPRAPSFVPQIHNRLSHHDARIEFGKSFFSKPAAQMDDSSLIGHKPATKAPSIFRASQEVIGRRILESAQDKRKLEAVVSLIPYVKFPHVSEVRHSWKRGRECLPYGMAQYQSDKNEHPTGVIAGVWVNEFNLPAKAVDRLPRAQELRDWFRIVALTGGKQGEHMLHQDIRKQLVRRISRFEKVHRQTLSVPGGDKEMQAVLTHAHVFGQQCLKTFSVETPIRKEKLEFLFNHLKQQLRMMKLLEADQLEEFFYWPIILAGSSEWYFVEANLFSEYMEGLKPVKTKKGFREYHGEDMRVKESINQEENEIYPAQEVKIISKILGEMEQIKDVENCNTFYDKITGEGNYSQLNATIEQFIFMHFYEELERYNDKKPNVSNISKEKLDNYYLNWGLKEGNILALFKVYHYSMTTRGKYTMNEELSKESYKNYGESLVKLTKDLLSREAQPNYPIDEKCLFDFFRMLYGWVEKHAGYLQRRYQY